ncbi:MAG: family 43 glycosylhydrolase [Candidatus Izemoplasmataceae bacterium]
MKNYYCNPVNIRYPYQFISGMGETSVNREGADPTLIEWQGKYYLFVSMTGGFWYSDDLLNWKYKKLVRSAVYDYAPDVRIIDDYMYLTASRNADMVPIYRSKDPINEEFEVVSEIFSYWDPHLFQDEDGRVYFYWGCSNKHPIWGIEMNRETLNPIGEKVALIYGHAEEHGFERKGDDHHYVPRTKKEILMAQYIGLDPFIEGAWMNKVNGLYYLQYSAPATQNNIYGDGVYVGKSPLGLFTYQKNNPFSYKPGGFIPGAGHGSTMQDKYGNWWHASTMVISANHEFERRVGLFPAGFDEDGELFCNTAYGDWPIEVAKKINPNKEPDWMLLSYNKSIKASSHSDDNTPNKANDEHIKTCWTAKSNGADEWLEINLGESLEVAAIQVNFADYQIPFNLPKHSELIGAEYRKRFIDINQETTNYHLQGSLDGKHYETIADKREVTTDLSNDFIYLKNIKNYKFIRISNMQVPYGQSPSISGLRVFGKKMGSLPPQITAFNYVDNDELDVSISWKSVKDTVGYNVVWGYLPEKMYHSYMVFDRNTIPLRALNKGQKLYVRIDTFNESGITKGNVVQVR